ncbi:MAG: hypothetical protein CUN49_14990 [Candidatus Thermofonsia Clade 1 bacterium]|jgi:hypothetical protein|uniref:von Hippel-Lindau disease tumour suppressor beta domain-containing protein n=1 Tax=Candidatus Thermofonsia Clade 1 bacterium TaxID=2364210 RepID=A0A2M8PAJ6_9CHLR|nr:MAG: hypothetical protein CUN49_14990 [Candidatus Thermofonsia Clade 1 bacterium]PJF43047.1 MAG: hypothetical protein CUN50_01995 [Candidatus Thermofonsia Clade 1 bacterium]
MRAYNTLIVILSAALLSGLAALALGAPPAPLAVQAQGYTPPFEGFDPDDGRAEPNPTDRIAIYCEAKWRDFEVWGVRADSTGYPLIVFEFDELTEVAGKPVVKTAHDGSRVVAWIDPEQPVFTVQWFNAAYGANGAPPFAKVFRCPFAWARTPTSTPMPRAPRLPVITLTPSPTPTALPTRPSF